MTVTLRPITNENWRHVYMLTETLSDEQRNFVADNAYSMLEAIWDTEHYAASAIYADETPVGFLMTAFEPRPHNHWIMRLMTGAEHQRKGYARAAIQMCLDEFRAMPDCAAVYISFEPENHAARTLYESLGFRDTGRIEYGERVFCLPLNQPETS